MTSVVVIPAYNEETSLAEVISGVQKYCSRIIVVDDGSTDQTKDVAVGAGADVVVHPINRGQGAAIQTGIEYALLIGADTVVTFDADGQHDPADILRFTAPIERKEVDVVLGSRFVGEKAASIPFVKRVVLKLALFHQWLFTGLHVTDNHCGLRALSRAALRSVVITQDRMSHASEILDCIASHKLSYREIPIVVSYTPYSRKKGQKNFTGALRIVYDFFIGRSIR